MNNVMTNKKRKYNNAFYERGSWYHRTKFLQEDGKVKYGKLGGFKTLEQAEESFRNNSNLFKEQQRIFLATKVNSEMMFQDFLIYWFENIYSERIENTTKMIGMYAIYDLIIPNIEYDIKLRQVTTAYLDDLLNRVSKINNSSGETGRLIIYMCLKDAVINGFINYNPAKETKPYPRPKPNITILSKEETKKFLQLAQYSNWYLEILLGLFCGLRKGEILGLKRFDFDKVNETITITRQLVNNPIIEKGGSKVIKYERIERPPKTENSYRQMKISKVVIEELQKREQIIDGNMKKHSDKYKDNGYISCNEYGDSHALSSMNIALKKICVNGSIPVITVHSLRHMFATILLEQGASLAQISGLLGHSSIHTTFEWYCGIMDENQKILSYMNDIFSVGDQI